jgi:hypothetical protein
MRVRLLPKSLQALVSFLESWLKAVFLVTLILRED